MAVEKIMLFFQISKLPDLSLNKYKTGNLNGVEGLIELHNTFLRQWNRKGISTGISMHLFYVYKPERSMGNKLCCLIGLMGEKQKLLSAVSLLKASALLKNYQLSMGFFRQKREQLLADVDILEEKKFFVEDLFSDQYDKMCILSKKELFIDTEPGNGNKVSSYYSIAEWEMNAESRLYQMFTLMESLGKSLTYRVDIYPVDKSVSIRNSFKEPIRMLRDIQNRKRYDENMGNRDYDAENILKSYERMSEEIEGAPHYNVNIVGFGKTDKQGVENDDVEVILDAAAADSLLKGTYTISTYHRDFQKGDYYSSLSYLMDYLETDCFSGLSKHLLKKTAKGLLVYDNRAKDFRLNFLPTLFTLEQLSPFFRLPVLYDGENIQIRKETAPPTISEEEGLYLGKDENGYDTYFPLKHLAKHAFIAGMPGSGKTNTMHHVTSRLWKKHNIPFLVLEPAKQEYRALANDPDMKGLYFFAPNAEMQFPLHINPFEFPKGLTVAEHIRTLVSVFEGAFPLDNPMPFLLDTAIEAVYRDLGWEPEMIYTESTKLKFPTMTMLYTRLEQELETTKYSDEVKGNLESALKVRIGSLLRREMGDVFDVPRSTITPERWLEIPAVIELESMGAGPANFLTLMLCALIREVLKVNPESEKEYARHVIFIEEAHNIIGPEAESISGDGANAKQAATAFIVKMLAEVRALKEGIVIADQLPTVMAQEVLKNTGLKIGLRIAAMDDRAVLGSTMSASPLQIDNMGTFNVGEALVSYEGIQKPFEIRIHQWWGELTDEIERAEMTISKRDKQLWKIMKDRDSYREICSRSFEIGVQIFVSEYQQLKRTIVEQLDYIREINQIEQGLRDKEIKIKFLLGDEDENEAKDQMRIAELANIYLEEKRELDLVYRKNEKYISIYSNIKWCIELIKKICLKKKYWKRMGFNVICQDNDDEKIKRIKRLLPDVEQQCLSWGQSLFAEARAHLKDAEDISSALDAAAMKISYKR